MASACKNINVGECEATDHHLLEIVLQKSSALHLDNDSYRRTVYETRQLDGENQNDEEYHSGGSVPYRNAAPQCK